jgi:isopenicillin N synthase-like dioxygenase
MLIPNLTLNLPLIDISPFLIDPESHEAKNVNLAELKSAVAETLHDACKNVGFFYLIGHGIDTAQCKNVHELARKFFSLPDESKDLRIPI